MLASSSKVQASYVEEVAYGVTPATAGKSLRITGESLNYAIQTADSSEINATRQVTDSIQVGATASGALNVELSYREFDPFLEAMLASTFGRGDNPALAFGTDGVKAITSVTFSTGPNTAVGSLTNDFQGIVAGQWVTFTGAAAVTAGVANKAYRVISNTVDYTTLTFDTDTPIPASASGIACNCCSSRLSNGTADLRTFSIQKAFTDVGQYFVYRGMSPSKLDLSFDTGSFLKGAITFMGANSARNTTSFITTPGPSQSFGAMNAVSNVGTILLDGNPLADTFIKSAKISIDGKLRGQNAIGHLGNVGVGQGTFAIGGSLEVYLYDGAVYDKAISNQLVSIQIPIMDVYGNGYAFIFNNAKLGVPSAQAGGKDADVMLSIPFSAVAPNTASDKMLIIDRFGAAAV